MDTFGHNIFDNISPATENIWQINESITKSEIKFRQQRFVAHDNQQAQLSTF